MVRLIRLIGPMLIGMTGWMLSTFATSSSSPTPKKVLFWNGRPDQVGDRFCDASARSARLRVTRQWSRECKRSYSSIEACFSP
jgi:hypothetical protein